MNEVIIEMYTRPKGSISKGEISSTQYASIAEFVSRSKGKRLIEKVLIANNGIGECEKVWKIKKYFELLKNILNGQILFRNKIKEQ